VAIIQRKIYLEKLRMLRDEQIIKVVVGVRRCGKSTVLEMFKDELLASGVSEQNIVFINFEEPETVRAEYEWRKVYGEILSQLQPGQMNYVFLDEVQAVDEWEKLSNQLVAGNFLN
jgi:predicted AAA+ superfamily ATPase